MALQDPTPLPRCPLSGWSGCSGNNAEGMPEQARSTERPSEPQVHGLTAFLGATMLGNNIRYNHA
jgi:hypothetical protein